MTNNMHDGEKSHEVGDKQPATMLTLRYRAVQFKSEPAKTENDRSSRVRSSWERITQLSKRNEAAALNRHQITAERREPNKRERVPMMNGL
jgi:hypothetical protein